MRLERILHGHQAGGAQALALPETAAARRSTLGEGTRFLAWVVGLAQLLLGLTMAVAPAQFGDAAYDALQPHLTAYGLAFCVSGLLLLTWQVLPLEQTRLPELSLLLASASFIVLAVDVSITHTWTEAATYALVALSLLVAATGAETWLREGLGVDLFMVTVAVERLTVGLVLLLASARLPAASYQFLQSRDRVWALSMLACALLLALWQLRHDRAFRLVIAAIAALPLLAWSYEVGTRSSLIATLMTSAVMASAVIVRPWFSAGRLMQPRERLANKLVAASVISVGTVLVLVVVFILQQTDSAYRGRAQLDLATTAQVVAHDSSSFVSEELQQATLLARDPEVVSFDPAQQLVFAQRVLQGDPEVSQISIVDKSGITVLRSTGEQPNIDRRGLLPGVAAIMESHQPNWDVIDSPSQGVPVLALRVPILAVDGSFNGVYVTQVRLSTLTRRLAELPLDKGERIVIVDGDGRVVAHPDPNLVANRVDLSGLAPVSAALGGRPKPLVYRDGDRRWLSVQVREPDLGWVILVEQPLTAVLAPANTAREQAIGFLALMLVVVTGTAVTSARGFSRPVVELAKAARAFGRDGSPPALPPAGGDEVGDLVHAFQEMGDRLAARTRERDRVEETLRDSEERYRSIVETAQEGIWILNARAETTFVNAKMAEMLICAVDDMLGRSLFSFVDVDDQAAAHANLELWRMGVAGQQEFKLRRMDGEELWVLASANPLHDHDGSFTGAIALVTNLTNRKRGEEERARLLAREQSAREEVEALLAATASLGVQADPDEVLRTLVAQAAGLLDARSATYAIRQGEVLSIHGRWVGDQWVHGPYELPVAGSIFGHVWSSGVAYRSNHLESDPFVNLDRLATTGHTSMLAAPLCAPDGEQLGCVAAFDSRRPDGFSERDERLLSAICETGAAVLLRARGETARLGAERSAARRKQEVEALLAAADRLNSAVEPEEVLLGVVGVAAEVLAVARVGIATNEGDHALRRHTWLDGIWHSVKTPLPLETSLSGWVIAHGRPFRSDDFRNTPLSYTPAALGEPPATTLAVPILARDGRVLGSLNLFDRRDGQPFSDDDQRLAEGIAHHAAVALERATLTAELRRSQQQLKQQAFSDALTGLPNRPLFLDRLAHALAVARRRSGGVAVLFLDLDGFKLVNDSLGHAAGDELLVSVANRLAKSQRAEDTVARFGGDEFAVLLENTAHPLDAVRAADRIIAELRRPFRFKRREIVITGSIGIALSNASLAHGRPEDLLREADIALYQAKAAGKAQSVVFDPSMSAQAVERLDLETSLRRAVERSELRLHYQPIVELRTGAIVGAEALVRWQHPKRGLLEPDAFIPLAEETGLILSIGRWVLHEACRQARAWQVYGQSDLPFRMSVNLSARQFEQPNLVAQVTSALDEAQLQPSGLELEITESTVIQNADATVAMLSALKDVGVRLAIDDFGTGYSSLSYLQRLSVDTLKIDRSFTDGLRREQSTGAIVQAVIAMAHALAIEVTAEGIETVDQLGFIRVLGCDYGQGFFLSKPMAPDRLEELLGKPLPG